MDEEVKIKMTCCFSQSTATMKSKPHSGYHCMKYLCTVGPQLHHLILEPSEVFGFNEDETCQRPQFKPPKKSP